MPHGRNPASPRRTRRARNLTLSDEAVARGEQHAAALGVSLSGLVDQILRALPPAEMPDEPELSPTVARLRRLLAHEDKPTDWRGTYREHLYRKHIAEPEE